MIPPGSCIYRDFNAPSYIYIQNQPLPFDDLEISVVFQRRLDKHKNKKKMFIYAYCLHHGFFSPENVILF